MTSTRARWAALGRYALLMLLMNLAWEASQMPLYTLWWTAPWREIAVAILHCTAGDGLIAVASLVMAVVLVGRGRWPDEGRRAVLIAAVGFGVAYTIFGEWWNVYVRHSWAYASRMPLLPGLGIGLSPLAQWIVLPAAGLSWIAHGATGPRIDPNQSARARRS